MVKSAVCSFRQRVEGFLSGTGVAEAERVDELRREIVRLAMQIQDGLGSLKLRKITYDYGCFDEFNNFKNQYLDVSYYLHRQLWKEVIKTAKELKLTANKKTPKVIPAENPDVEYCLRALELADIRKLKEKQILKHLDVDTIDLNNWETGETQKRDLIKYAKSKIGKFRHLCEHDPALDNNDFTQELLCEVVRVFNSYPRSKCKNLPVKNDEVSKNCVEKNCSGLATHGNRCEQHDLENRVQMYIETALNNKVMNIKEYYSCESRRRIASTDHEVYKARSKLKKALQKDPVIRELTAEISAVKSIISGQVKQLKDLMYGVSDINTTPAQKGLLEVVGRMLTVNLSESVSGTVSVLKRREFEGKVASIISGQGSSNGFVNFLDGVVAKAKLTEYYGIVNKYNDETLLKGALTKMLESRENQLKDISNNHPLHKELLDIEKKVENSKGDYYTTTVSLVRKANDDSVEKDLEISHDQVAAVTGETDSVFGSAYSLHTKMWVDSLCENVDPNTARFVRIVVGDHDAEFEKWALEQHVDTSLFVAMVNGAKRFLNIKTSELKKNPVILQILKGQHDPGLVGLEDPRSSSCTENCGA